jgi:hypothetical protein
MVVVPETVVSPEQVVPALGFPFTRDRFVHRLVERHGDPMVDSTSPRPVCLVERENLVTKSSHWEVVILQWQRERTIRGETYPAGEAYPGSNAWGRYGWTYTTLSEAYERYRICVAARDSSPAGVGDDPEASPGA